MSNYQPYKVFWVDLDFLGYHESLAIGSLPGPIHRFVTRCFDTDAGVILQNGIQHCFILCEELELHRFRLTDLDEKLEAIGIVAHRLPVEIGLFPSMDELLAVVRQIFTFMEQGQKVMLMSRDGLGRAAVIAGALMLQTNDAMMHDDVYNSLKQLLGARAIQTVKQYNFLVDFRNIRDEYLAKKELEANDPWQRELSR